MKKVFAFVLVLSLLLCCAACGESNSTAGDGNIEGSLTDLLAKVTDGATDPEMSLIETEVTEDMFSWYLFIDPIDGAEAVVSEPMIGSIPHSVVLLRVPDSADAEQVRSEIEEKLDPRKWVCVEAEKTAVLRRGNLILMVMSDTETTDKVISNFSALS
ncbi:MAG: hypothetical protein J1E06_02390 [Acutalibacter sp.]|nr:hypothetical protein [Acutalibacter sp.]